MSFEEVEQQLKRMTIGELKSYIIVLNGIIGISIFINVLTTAYLIYLLVTVGSAGHYFLIFCLLVVVFFTITVFTTSKSFRKYVSQLHKLRVAENALLVNVTKLASALEQLKEKLIEKEQQDNNEDK